MNNYRPISLLPVFSKIFEKIVQKQVYSYLNNNNLLFDSQHGFRENYSTESAVIELTDHLKSQIDKHHLPMCLFLDLSKAFDTINFDIMLMKLRHLGFNSLALNWFETYLKHRKQFVSFNGSDSPLLETKTGVPQGSVLGPLLFLIYINDIDSVSNIFKIICFADDSTLIVSLCAATNYCRLCNLNNVFSSDFINQELDKIYNWFCINKLSINPDKIKFMIFKNKQRNTSNMFVPTLKLNNKILERVHDFLYLGIFLDEDMTWNSHINYMANKISKNIGILKRLKHTLPKNILKTLYDTLIHSHLNYGTLLWGFNIDRLKKLQKQAIRVITDSYYLEHTNGLFKILKILKLEDISDLKQLIFYHKFINNNLPCSINNFLTRQNRNLRICHTAYFLQIPPATNTEIAKLCIRYSIPTFINGQDKKFIESIESLSVQTTKELFKKKTFDSYSFECTIENCYPCYSRFFSSFGFNSCLKFLHIFYYLRNVKFIKPFLSSGFLSYINIYNYTDNPR